MTSIRDPELQSDLPSDGSRPDRPFHVILQPQNVVEEVVESHAEDEEFEEEPTLSLEEIEAAYLAALETAELMEDASLEAIAEATVEPSSSRTDDDDVGDFPDPTDGISELSSPQEAIEPESLPQTPIDCAVEATASTPEQPIEATPSSFVESPPPQNHSSLATSQQAVSVPESVVDEETLITPTQVLEALLFVGGGPLSTKKLLDILGGSMTSEQLETLLLNLNTQYQTEGRPYEIRMQSGGYVMQLLERFESVRGRSYGHGPKEVKLAQDALEVLAFVAYQQPVTRAEVEATEKPNTAKILRQLLRRQLVVLERNDQDVAQYRTTNRFLTLFGLHSLDDLPQVGDFNFK